MVKVTVHSLTKRKYRQTVAPHWVHWRIENKTLTTLQFQFSPGLSARYETTRLIYINKAVKPVGSQRTEHITFNVN